MRKTVDIEVADGRTLASLRLLLLLLQVTLIGATPSDNRNHDNELPSSPPQLLLPTSLFSANSNISPHNLHKHILRSVRFTE